MGSQTTIAVAPQKRRQVGLWRVPRLLIDLIGDGSPVLQLPHHDHVRGIMREACLFRDKESCFLAHMEYIHVCMCKHILS